MRGPDRQPERFSPRPAPNAGRAQPAVPPQPCDVAVGRAADGRGAVADHDASPPAAVDAVEGEAPDPAGDVVHGVLVERDEVGEAPHEADPAPVLDNGDGVARQQRTAAGGARGPVQHCGTVEVAADPCQGDPGDGLDVVVEQLDAGRGPLNPLLVRARDQDTGIESLGELDVGAVEVRVGHTDRVDTAQGGDSPLRVVVEQRDAVPQHIAVRCTDEKRALADRDRRAHTDADEVRFLLPQFVGVVAGQFAHRGPALSPRADVLTLVLADRAVRRRLFRVRVLHGTGHTDPGRHTAGPLSSGSRQTHGPIPRRHPPGAGPAAASRRPRCARVRKGRRSGLPPCRCRVSSRRRPRQGRPSSPVGQGRCWCADRSRST